MNINVLHDLIKTKSNLTIYMNGHVDPFNVDRNTHKPVIDMKRKTLTIGIPSYCYTRMFIIDVGSITHVEYAKY